MVFKNKFSVNNRKQQKNNCHNHYKNHTIICNTLFHDVKILHQKMLSLKVNDLN